MMLDDHWSSFENALASNSTHCRVWKVIGLIRFSRLEHVAAWWSTTVDYHHITPPYSTIIPFAVWSCTRMQAETAYSEDHNLNSHGSHAPSCTTSFFRGGTNEANQEEVQAHHSINWKTLENHQLPQNSGWFLNAANQVHIGELQMSYVHSYRSCPSQIYPTLLNEVCKAHTDVAKWRDWKSKKFEHLSVNHERSPEMWPGGTKALEMMLDDHWSSFENTLASNSTHCRVQKVIRLIRFSRLKHVAALWSTTVDYHHIPPYSAIISFAVWSCTRMQAESAYSEDHNLSSHGSHAPSCTASFFRGGTNEANQEEVQAHHSINWKTFKNHELPQKSGWFVNAANQVHFGEFQMSYVHSYRSCPSQIYPTLLNEVYIPNPIEWDLESTYWRSQMTGLKVKEVWTSVCKPWMQSPEMWPGGTKALEMMLDDHWSSFENTLASNSTHCRVWKVIGLIRFSRLKHVAALWSTTVDYHHIPPPYSTIISFAVWSCTRMQAESAYSEDHNLSSHGSHAP